MLEKVWRKGTFLHCWWECKLIQPLWKMIWRFLKQLGIKPPYDPEIPLLGIYPEEIKIEKDTCIPLLTAALFTTARTWKQPRCPLTNEWIKKLWYIYTMQYYSAIKRNAFESVLMKWMNLETIIQSVVSQKEKHQYCILLHIYGILEKVMSSHSSTLAWKTPWMEEPGRLQSMGSQSRTRLSNFTFTFHFHALEKEMATHSSVLA